MRGRGHEPDPAQWAPARTTRPASSTSFAAATGLLTFRARSMPHRIYDRLRVWRLILPARVLARRLGLPHGFATDRGACCVHGGGPPRAQLLARRPPTTRTGPGGGAAGPVGCRKSGLPSSSLEGRSAAVLLFFFLSSAAPPLVCYSTGARAARLFVGRRLLLATRRSRYYGGPPRKRREGGGRKRTPPSSRPVRGSVREWGVIAGEFVFCILHPPRTHTAHHRPS